MKKIVVYYSLDGNTKYVAEIIAKKMNADILSLEPEIAYPTKGVKKYWNAGKDTMLSTNPKLKPYTFDADEYDEVILCTPTWSDGPATPINTFISENQSTLATKKISAFAGYRGHGAEKAIEKMRKAIGVDEISHKLTLVVPKEKPDKEKEQMINRFCNEFLEK